MKKLIPLMALVFIIPIVAVGQRNIQPVDTSKYYAFYINYWFNMHHFLWLEAFLNTEADSTLIKQELSDADKRSLDYAIKYYKENLTDKDLRTHEYMTNFKFWISEYVKDFDQIPAEFKKHMEVLVKTDLVYKEYFWPKHKQACENVLRQNLSMIKLTEDEYVDRITLLTRQFWQFEKIRVDITGYAKATSWNLRNRPYTTLFPTYVVMNAFGENHVSGNWLELLYHESAHHLILTNSYFVGGTLRDIEQAEQLDLPRQLGHAYLFFFTGQLTKELLQEQGVEYPATYMERNGLYSRYYPLLEKHLMPYMKGKITLNEATKRFIKDYNQ